MSGSKPYLNVVVSLQFTEVNSFNGCLVFAKAGIVIAYPMAKISNDSILDLDGMNRNMMIDNVDNIFDYDLKDIEHEVLNLAYDDEVSYLLFTLPYKILCDLHLLFLVRKDKKNRNRIIDQIRHYKN